MVNGFSGFVLNVVLQKLAPPQPSPWLRQREGAKLCPLPCAKRRGGLGRGEVFAFVVALRDTKALHTAPPHLQHHPDPTADTQSPRSDAPVGSQFRQQDRRSSVRPAESGASTAQTAASAPSPAQADHLQQWTARSRAASPLAQDVRWPCPLVATGVSVPASPARALRRCFRLHLCRHAIHSVPNVAPAGAGQCGPARGRRCVRDSDGCSQRNNGSDRCCRRPNQHCTCDMTWLESSKRP